ncbi:MAG: bifunctional oligoribonuclease/PAP phosphatase NrnA [Candidatus Gracilibacteria bacterium]|jgi:phosphoesterase RecJ-like protein
MLNQALEAFGQAQTLLLQAKRVVIIAHRNPDADAVGSNLAMREVLESLGKEVISACMDPIPESCRFLRKAETFVQDFDSTLVDLVITQDCGGHKVMGFHEKKPELLDRTKMKLLNIDHHPSNDYFGTVNIVMPEAPATCFILFLMFASYSWPITPTMATALFHGLSYDTGSFMHSNVTADCLRVGARLKALGADLEKSVKEQFHTASIPKLRLWGRALSRVELNDKNAVVTAVTEQDYRDENANLDDLSGLVTYLSHVPQTKFGMLLTEDFKGNIKGSLRTQDETIDLTKITALFGGGGHKKASGFTIPGRLVEKRTWSIT